MRPGDLIEECGAAHRSLLDGVQRLTDAEVFETSNLPGWSRGHVISHLARNADSLVWLFEGAKVGEVRSQYPSLEKRKQDIDAGAGRSTASLHHDLLASCDQLELRWRELPDELWDREGNVLGGTRAMHELVFRRLREVEVHHVDLDIGYLPSDWPSAYVEGELQRSLPGIVERADHTELVTWLLGRSGAPALAPW